MQREMFEKIYEETKNGALHQIVYARTTNGYTKQTTMVVRFVNYYNTKAFLESGRVPSANTNPNVVTIIPHVLTYNAKTGNYLVHCYPMPNSKSKAKVVYTNATTGQEVTKEEYETANPPKNNTNKTELIVFTIKLQDLVSVSVSK